MQDLRDTEKHFRIDIVFSEYFVQILTPARHLLGEPHHRAVLLLQFFLNQSAYRYHTLMLSASFPAFRFTHTKKTWGSLTFAYPGSQAFALPTLQG